MLCKSLMLSSLLFFLLILTFAALLEPAQSALWFSRGDLQGEAAYTSCFTQVFPHPVLPSLGSRPWRGEVEDQKEHLKCIKAL